METKETLNTKVITGTVRLSFANVWKPTAIDENAEKKYNTALIIPKSDKVTVNAINKVVNALKESFKAKNDGKLPAKFKLPLRDGDEERPDDPAYANAYFLNANSKTKPGIVDRNRVEIIDEEEVYSGCYARVSLNFFTFNTAGSKGIGCGLNNIMKVKDGEKFSGRASADEDFAEVVLTEDDDDSFLD